MIPEVLAGATREVCFSSGSGIEIAIRVDGFGLCLTLAHPSLESHVVLLDRYVRTLDEHAQTRYFACFALACLPPWEWPLRPICSRCFSFYEALTLALFTRAHKETSKPRRAPASTSLSVRGRQAVLLRDRSDLQRGRHPRLPPGRNPAGQLRLRLTPRSRGRLCAVLFGLAKKRRHTLHSWCGGDGGANSGQRASARRGRRQDRRLRDAPRLCLSSVWN